MKAIFLLGTLKKQGLSNTETLCEFLAKYFEKQKVNSEIIKLVEHKILAGTYSNMGEGDEWPEILEKILAADFIVLATPIWWNNQSSEIQRVIERLDKLHDEIMEGKESRLARKAGGIVITGDSDGAQSIISNIGNFYNSIGLIFPAFSSLSVLWEKQKKGAKTSRKELMDKYEKDYSETAEKMVKQMMEGLKFKV